MAPDKSDPYDARNFPSSQYPYAFEVFGNNGSTPRGAVATSSSNNSLLDLANASTVLADLQQFGSGSTSTGSDHYPIVGDYSLLFPGDINRDGKVTVADISTLMSALSDLNAYRAAKNLTDPQQFLEVADVNGDGAVNNADLQALISLVANNAVGGSGTLIAVPEPDSWILASLALVAGLNARWLRGKSPVQRSRRTTPRQIKST